MTFIYTPPEPDFRRLSDLQSGIDNWYSPTTLRSEVERVRRETVEACAKICERYSYRDTDMGSILAKEIRELLK